MSSTRAGGLELGERAKPPMRGLLGAAGAAVYGAAIGWRNRRFDAGKGVVTFDRPVISVGNLSVGGTGKTPMVLHLARVLREAGRTPCIAMRGYRARGAGADGAADEAAEYHRALRGVPVVAQADRTAGLIELFGTEHGSEVDCVILDDGFQHRRIARQFDVVLIDATRPPWGDRLLPAGWLREPVESLRRAHAAVVTHAETVTRTDAIEIETRLWEYFPNVHGAGVVAVARHEWVGLSVMGEEGDVERPVEWLAGKRVYAACAIGNPGAFVAGVRRVLEGEFTAEGSGRGEEGGDGGRGPRRVVSGEIVGTMVLRDHAEFGPEVVARLMEELRRERADVVVVTEKDWSKLMGVEGWPCPVARPRLEMRFERGGEELAAAVIGCVQDVLAQEEGTEAEGR